VDGWGWDTYLYARTVMQWWFVEVLWTFSWVGALRRAVGGSGSGRGSGRGGNELLSQGGKGHTQLPILMRWLPGVFLVDGGC